MNLLGDGESFQVGKEKENSWRMPLRGNPKTDVWGKETNKIAQCPEPGKLRV